MLGSSTFELVLGLTFVFLTLSLVVSTVREALESRLKTRARHLAKGIAQLLGDANRAQRFYDFPLIKALHDGGTLKPLFQNFRGLNVLSAIGEFSKMFWSKSPPTGFPSYVPKRTFALALLQLVRDGAFVDALTPGALAETAARANLTASIVAGVATANAATVKTIADTAQTIAQAKGALLPSAVPQTPLSAPAMVEIKAALAAAIQANPANELAKSISAVLVLAGDDAEKAVDGLEKWYDGTMDRVSGWYKRESQHIMFWLGLLVAVALNVDAIHLTKYLYANPEKVTALVAQADVLRANPAQMATLRQAVVPAVQKTSDAAPAAAPAPGASEAAAAGSGAQTSDATTSAVKSADAELTKSLKRVLELNLPIGWSPARIEDAWKAGKAEKATMVATAIQTVIGWIVTAFMLSFGAPFWFDLFNKMMVVRSTVKPTEKSPDEASEDGQKKVS